MGVEGLADVFISSGSFFEFTSVTEFEVSGFYLHHAHSQRNSGPQKTGEPSRRVRNTFMMFFGVIRFPPSPVRTPWPQILRKTRKLPEYFGGL